MTRGLRVRVGTGTGTGTLKSTRGLPVPISSINALPFIQCGHGAGFYS